MDNWIPVSERLPEPKKGDYDYFNVVIKRKHNGKSYSIPALYLNEYVLISEDDDADEDGNKKFTGWFTEGFDGEYDSNFKYVEDNGDVITHWMPLPEPPTN